MNLPCVVITSPDAQPAFRGFLSALGAHIVALPTERRWPVLERIIDETGFMPASNLTRFHTGNPFGPEGYKTIAYEIFAQLGGVTPGTVVLPTGYGELLYGVAKGFRELVTLGLAPRTPRIVSAEPAVRAPLAKAMANNQPAQEVSGAPSLAVGIACTVSSYRAVLGLRDTGGRALTFQESTIVMAQQALAAEGLWQEYSGAAGLAALREATQRGEAFEGPVVVVLTSTGLKEAPAQSTSVPFDERSLDRLIAILRESRGETG
jgi:threonine synthase